MVHLRDACADDADVVGRIYIDSWNEGFGHLLGRRKLLPDRVARWRHELTDGSVGWTIAEHDAEIVGFVGVGRSRDPLDPDLGELHAIAVDPPIWREGVGRALMAHAIHLLDDEWSRAILWTPANYDRGHDFYRATGWQSLGSRRANGTEVAFGRKRHSNSFMTCGDSAGVDGDENRPAGTRGPNDADHRGQLSLEP